MPTEFVSVEAANGCSDESHPTQDAAPLNILQVVEPGIDGVFRCVEMLTGLLLDEGHRVSLAYSNRRGGDRLVRLVERVREAGGETLNLGVSNAPELGDLSAACRLWSLVRRLRPDVVHAHSSKAGVLARSLALAGLPARFLYTPHAYYGLAGRPGVKTALFNGIERAFGRIGISCMSSTGERDFARSALGIPASRLSLMRNPIDSVSYAPARDACAARERFGLPADAIVLGSVGRLSFQKDPQTLYRALVPAIAEEPRLHLLHIGRGELDADLREFAVKLGIDHRIRRVEYVERPALAYEAMDGLILTSRYEGFSLVLLEALACDLPLIVSRVQGVADIEPEHLSHCWTAEPGDVRGFAEAITAWSRDLSRGRTRNHRATAIERFSMHSWFDRHLQLYRGEQ